MKPTAVSADALFEDHRGKLKWQWIAGLGASERRFDEVAVRAARSGADLVGYLNYIHPYRLQLLGDMECTAIFLRHLRDAGKMSACSAQAVDYGLVGRMVHIFISPSRMADEGMPSPERKARQGE